ncbi:MAG: hypothetical protein E7568_01865 [Ruminococcaceae bacterium]|nr:hypothetical protein [Oscillospiraceae bacterium]
MKKTLALLLCVCLMTYTAVPAVFAVETVGVGSYSYSLNTDDSMFDHEVIFGDNIRLDLSSAEVVSGADFSINGTLGINHGFTTAVINIEFDKASFVLNSVTANNSNLAVQFAGDSNGAVITLTSKVIDQVNNVADFTQTGEIITLNFTALNVSGDYEIVVNKNKSWGADSDNTPLNVGQTKGYVTASCAHVFSEETIIKYPTCTEKGVAVRICTLCGKSAKTDVGATGHDNGTWRVKYPADCVNNGQEARFCTKCDAVLETRVIAATGTHAMGWVTIKEATCYSEGVEIYMCSLCCLERGDTRAIPKLPHREGEHRITREPTCSAVGVISVFCKDCNAVVREEYIDKTTHEKGRLEVITAPALNNSGEGKYHCKHCDAVLNTVTLEPVSDTIYAEAPDTVALPGDTVRIPVKVSDHSGFAYGIVRVDYNPDAFTLDSCTIGDVPYAISVGEATEGNLVVLMEIDEENYKEDGVLFYLDFTVNDGATTQDVDIYYNPETDFCDEYGNITFVNISGFEFKAQAYLVGDADGDKEITINDLALMKLYLVGAVDDIGLGADVDTNGSVTTTDLALMKLHLTGVGTGYMLR